MSLEDSRHIRLSNTLTLMLIFSSIIIGSILWFEYGLQLITLQVLAMAPLFASIYWLTYLGYNKASRIFITIVTPLAVIITTVSIKFNNRDLVDLSAPKILGKWLVENPEKRIILYKFVKSKNLWEKRIAIISTHSFIRENDFKDTLEISKTESPKIRSLFKKSKQQLFNSRLDEDHILW